MKKLKDYVEGISNDLEEMLDKVVAAREALANGGAEKALRLMSSAEDALRSFHGVDRCEPKGAEEEAELSAGPYKGFAAAMYKKIVKKEGESH